MLWTEGKGDRMVLPCGNGKLSVDAHALGGVTPDHDKEYKKPFFVINDSIFYLFGHIADKSMAAMMFFPTTGRHEYDGLMESRSQIEWHVDNALIYNSRDAVHVLSFGFDDIRFNLDKKPTEIADKVLEALNAAAVEVKDNDIKLWFVTIPEIGDLAAKFREFNTFFRHAAGSGKLKNVSLVDFSKMALTRPDSTAGERFFMLLSFFEQTCNLKLLTDDARSQYAVLEDPNSFVVKVDVSGDAIVATANVPSSDLQNLRKCLTEATVPRGDDYDSLSKQFADIFLG